MGLSWTTNQTSWIASTQFPEEWIVNIDHNHIHSLVEFTSRRIAAVIQVWEKLRIISTPWHRETNFLSGEFTIQSLATEYCFDTNLAFRYKIDSWLKTFIYSKTKATKMRKIITSLYTRAIRPRHVTKTTRKQFGQFSGLV